MEKSGTQQQGTQTPFVTMELLSGTWRAEGNTLTLFAPYPSTFLVATYVNRELTYSDNGRTYVWRHEDAPECCRSIASADAIRIDLTRREARSPARLGQLAGPAARSLRR